MCVVSQEHGREEDRFNEGADGEDEVSRASGAEEVDGQGMDEGMDRESVVCGLGHE